jgi:hypothetical protein
MQASDRDRWNCNEPMENCMPQWRRRECADWIGKKEK